MKGIKGILIILIIISICLLTYMIFFVDPIHEYTYEEYKIMQEGENPELEAALKIRIFPENREFLEEKYNGNLDLNYLYEKIHELVHQNITTLQNDLEGLNATELNTYFENNKANLISSAGITTIQELSMLSVNIQGKSINDTEYIDSVIDTSSYIEDEKYDSVNITINYKTCKLYFKIYIANDMLTSPMIIFESVSGEE